jgi:hypothetical protein
MRHPEPKNRALQFDTRCRPFSIGISISSLCALLIIFFSFPGCEENIPVPEHLIGEWRTTSAQYEDRYLKITENSLIFGIGDGEAISHHVEGVNVGQENGETMYTIHYKDMEGERWSLILIYRDVSGGTIKLKNDKVVWEKVKSESPA